MVKPVEIYAAFAPDKSACVVAIQNRRDGHFSITRQQLLKAKRKMQVPDWVTVFLRPNGDLKQLQVISFRPDDDEVITCAS